MKVYKRAILPRGFLANGLPCGIKKNKHLDLALFYSESPAKAVCLFTSNSIKASHIKIDEKNLKTSKNFRAILVNSGNANTFTGEAGIRDIEELAYNLARILKIKKENILFASTGIIGKRLPVSKIKDKLSELVKGLSCKAIDKAKQAILTTDTFPKEFTVRFNLDDRQITLCGIAKGAGMISPNLATMLAFLFTDAYISKTALKRALKEAVDLSFNCITVDGCMSTNDTVIILANGRAKNALIQNDSSEFEIFKEALKKVCLELAKLIVKDAEGATKFIQIKVNQAKDYREAKRVALSIANSNLFKTAMYGENPNFGRIIAAVGASGIDLEERDLKIKVSSLDKKEIAVELWLNRGEAKAVIYTSDLTPQYIKINAEYN
jgi:glutamate N-acetyltransferase/amino-acid N-acetyltransferase